MVLRHQFGKSQLAGAPTFALPSLAGLDGGVKDVAGPYGPMVFEMLLGMQPTSGSFGFRHSQAAWRFARAEPGFADLGAEGIFGIKLRASLRKGRRRDDAACFGRLGVGFVRNIPPVGDGKWRLYDHAKDPAEVNDLAATMPDLFEAMLADYETYAARSGVLALPDGYQAERQVRLNAIARQLSFHAGALIAIGAGVFALLSLLIFWLLRRRKRKRAAGA